MKKFTSMIISVCLSTALLASCGASSSSTSTAASSAPTKAVSSTVTASSTSAPAASSLPTEADNSKALTISTAVGAVCAIVNPVEYTVTELEYDIGFAADEVVSFAGSLTSDNNASGMILVVEAAEGKSDAVVEKLTAYRDNTANFLGNYPEFADATAAAKEGRVTAKGNYVVFAIAAAGLDYAAVDAAIETALA